MLLLLLLLHYLVVVVLVVRYMYTHIIVYFNLHEPARCVCCLLFLTFLTSLPLTLLDTMFLSLSLLHTAFLQQPAIPRRAAAT